LELQITSGLNEVASRAEEFSGNPENSDLLASNLGGVRCNRTEPFKPCYTLPIGTRFSATSRRETEDSRKNSFKCEAPSVKKIIGLGLSYCERSEHRGLIPRPLGRFIFNRFVGYPTLQGGEEVIKIINH